MRLSFSAAVGRPGPASSGEPVVLTTPSQKNTTDPSHHIPTAATHHTRRSTQDPGARVVRLLNPPRRGDDLSPVSSSQSSSFMSAPPPPPLPPPPPPPPRDGYRIIIDCLAPRGCGVLPSSPRPIISLNPSSDDPRGEPSPPPPPPPWLPRGFTAPRELRPPFFPPPPGGCCDGSSSASPGLSTQNAKSGVRFWSRKNQGESAGWGGGGAGTGGMELRGDGWGRFTAPLAE